MKVKAVLQTPRFNRDEYVKKLGTEIADMLALAVLEWMGAALAEIPVWSGASHGTFLHLARAVGTQLSIPSKSGVPRRVNLGLRTSDGEFVIDAEHGEFYFSYETRLKHLVYNEFHNANVDPDPDLFSRLIKPGPYDFQGRARVAVSRVLQSIGLPDPRPFIKVKVQRVK